MIKTSYQTPEIRDSNDNIVQQGAFGKNTPLSNSTNDGWIDYVVNNLEAIHDTIGDSAATLDGNGHVVEPCNLAIGDEDGNRLKTSYLKLTGGTISGTVNVAQNLKMQDNQENQFGGIYVPSSSATQQFAQFYGGTTPATTGVARLTLYSDDDNHRFELRGGSANGSTDYVLTHTDAGALTWRGNALATLASPTFTGNPTAPTQATNNNSTRLATTAYVINDLKSNAPLLADSLTEIIPSGADLNDYKTAGTYRTTSASITNSLLNCPVTNIAIKLMVIQIGYGSLAYGMQMLITSDARIYVRSIADSSMTSWLAWRRLAVTDNVLSLSGGTLTGNLTLQGTSYKYVSKNTNWEKGTAPASATENFAFQFQDTDGTNLGGISKLITSGRVVSTRIYNCAWAAGSSLFHVGVYADASDNKDFRPSIDNNINLGVAGNRWKQLYAGTTTIATSDERLKDNIAPIDDAVLDAWGEVNWYQYQFKDSIEEKGESRARLHTGAIAQRIESVFTAHGLDANRYGLLCYDEWNATPAERDEQGNITTPAQPAGNRYSLRYEEALCMEAAYQRRRADRLEERIARLEALVSGQE